MVFSKCGIKKIFPDTARLLSAGLTLLLVGAGPENGAVNHPAIPPAANIPAVIILPWTEIGISRETVALSRAAMTAAREALIKSAAPSAQPLSKVASPAMPATLQTLAQKIQVSATFLSSAPSPAPSPAPGPATIAGPSVTYAPVWCAMGASYIFHLIATDTVKNTLIGHAAFRADRPAWEKKPTPKSLTPIAEGVMADLYQDIRPQVEARLSAAKSEDALHVGFALAKETTRLDQGSSLCINLLVSGRMIKNYVVTNSIAGEYMAAIRHALQMPAQLRRPTRSVLVNWGFSPTQMRSKAASLQFPLQLSLTSQYSETVLGQPVSAAPESTWTFVADEKNKISVGLDTGLVQFLDGEKRALNLADSPQAAKINGAWVYLDRGRAYGLHMDDRMVGKSATGQDISGHIVGFFGPEMGLKSPRGHQINEGAILFVRKGQRETATGQSYTFDPQRYP